MMLIYSSCCNQLGELLGADKLEKYFVLTIN
jgi:hypothetical protein